MAGDINDILRQGEWRPGRPYFNPAHVVSVDRGQFGVPYWMYGLPMAGWPNLYVSSPNDQRLKDIQFHNTIQIMSQPVIGAGGAQAPTSGIYTGVEDHCG